MKKIVILAMLCVFSLVSIQSAEAKSFDGGKAGKDVGKFERKVDYKNQNTQMFHQNKFNKKVVYMNGLSKQQKHHFLNGNSNRIGGYHKHKNNKILTYNRYNHNFAKNNHHNDYFRQFDRNDRRNSFYR